MASFLYSTINEQTRGLLTVIKELGRSRKVDLSGSFIPQRSKIRLHSVTPDYIRFTEAVVI